MAETWTYGLYWTYNNNAQIPGDYSSITMTLKRMDNTGKDGSFYKLSSSNASFVSNVDVKTWGNGGLTIGSYGSTDDIGNNSSRFRINTTLRNIPNSLLSVGSSGVTVSVTRTSSSQTIYIYGTENSPAFQFTVTVEDKYSATTGSAGSVDFGGTSVVTLSNANISDLKHVVKWTVGSHSSSVETSTGASSASLTIPAAWMDVVPNSTSISCSIEIKTYKGSTQIGSATNASCTVSVPASVKPTIGSITCTIRNENQGIPGTYIQNTTGVYIQINNVAAGTGASIVDYPISANVTETYVFDSTNMRYYVDKLANCGEITFSVSVKDSRGRQSAPATATISVMEYALPSITVASAYRCRSSGIADDEGTYACIRIVANYSQTGGNTMDIDSTYYRSDIPSQKYTAQADMESGVSYIIGNNLLDPGYAYFVQFTIEDSLGNIITRDVRVQTSAFAIHVKNGGTGVAVGKTSEVANSFEINEGWDMYYKGVVQPSFVYYIPTVAQPEPSNPFEGMVWLKPKT